MRKLSDITESVWVDMHKISTGESVRKEDDINLLNPDDFVAYIRKIYRIDNTPYDIENRINAGTEVPNIFIPIYSAGTKNIKLGAIYFAYNDNEVYIHSSIKKYIPELWEKLNQSFDLLDGNGITFINPKDTSRKVNNSYVIELLNYICDNLDDTVKPCISRKTNESVWVDMHKISTGETMRKEDDINLLDRDGLYDYLTSHYKNTNSFVPIYNSETFDTIKVPFLIQGGSDCVYLSFEENEVFGENEVSIPYSSPYKVKGLFSKLANEFSLKSDAKTGHTWYIISPKDGSEVTNKFFIEVIDFIIDNIPDTFERGVKRVVNESVWVDMHKISTGETVRKEEQGKFYEDFKKIQDIPDSELIKGNSKFSFLWLPYNFGSDDVNKPGLYLNGEDIMELYRQLEGTEYHIATYTDWRILVNTNPFVYVNKAGFDDGYWTYVLKCENKELCIPNFGWISSQDLKQKIHKAIKKDIMAYGAVVFGKPGYMVFENNNDYINVKYNISPDKSDSLQVRLIKTPGSVSYWNKKS